MSTPTTYTPSRRLRVVCWAAVAAIVAAVVVLVVVVALLLGRPVAEAVEPSPTATVSADDDRLANAWEACAIMMGDIGSADVAQACIDTWNDVGEDLFVAFFNDPAAVRKMVEEQTGGTP